MSTDDLPTKMRARAGCCPDLSLRVLVSASVS